MITRCGRCGRQSMRLCMSVRAGVMQRDLRPRAQGQHDAKVTHTNVKQVAACCVAAATPLEGCAAYCFCRYWSIQMTGMWPIRWSCATTPSKLYLQICSGLGLCSGGPGAQCCILLQMTRKPSSIEMCATSQTYRDPAAGLQGILRRPLQCRSRHQPAYLLVILHCLGQAVTLRCVCTAVSFLSNSTA